MRKKQSSGLFFSPREIPVRVRGESFPTTTKSTCFLVRQVLFLLFCLFVSLCTGIEQPVRPRRSRRSRPGGTVLRTVPQGAGDSRTGHQKHLLSCKAGAFSFVPPFCKALYGNRTARPAAAKPAVPAGWDSPADCSTGRGRFSVRVTKSTCFLVRQVLFLLFCFFVRLCTGIEQPVRPRRSRRSRPGQIPLSSG